MQRKLVALMTKLSFFIVTTETELKLSERVFRPSVEPVTHRDLKDRVLSCVAGEDNDIYFGHKQVRAEVNCRVRRE